MYWRNAWKCRPKNLIQRGSLAYLADMRRLGSNSSLFARFVLASYSGGSEFNSRPWDWVSWLGYSWFSLVSSENAEVVPQNRPRQLPSTSFPIHCYHITQLIRRCIIWVTENASLNVLLLPLLLLLLLGAVRYSRLKIPVGPARGLFFKIFRNFTEFISFSYN
jgi:hypothetical protein